jgi:hypothetical protein
MSPYPKPEPIFSCKQVTFACLLIIGSYFPTSTDGEHSFLAIVIAFSILLGLLAYLAWKGGVRRKAVAFISFPIVILPAAFTLFGLCRGPVDVDWALLVKFGALALVLGLDLRKFRPGPLVSGAFVLVNLLNLAGGIAILTGSEWMAEFLPRYYWTALDELVPSMVALHKPVLTFGTHSLAGCFIYLFFWMNWEEFRLRGRRLSLLFALGNFVLLLGLASFTAFGFATLAAVQMAICSWKANPKVTAVAALCVIAVVSILAHALAEEIGDLGELPQIADTAFLNSDFSGPVSRYGPNGTLRPAIMYLFDNPLLPIGLARSASGLDVSSPSHFFIGDSGTLEYILRGSVPLLLLIYIGLYRFLHHNLSLRRHALLLFLVIILFETGFELFDYFRTLYMLPFFVVYLNQTVTQRMSCSPHGVAFPERQAFSV